MPVTDPQLAVELLLGGGTAAIAYLIKRVLADHDACLKALAASVAELRERTARTESVSAETKEHLRNLRQDMKEVKHAVEGLADHLMHRREGR